MGWSCSNSHRAFPLALAAVPQEYALLYEEASFFQLAPLQAELRRWRGLRESESAAAAAAPWECVAVQVAQDPHERITLSGRRTTLGETFPEVRELVRKSGSARPEKDPAHVCRFPLDDDCTLNSVQVSETLK